MLLQPIIWQLILDESWSAKHSTLKWKRIDVDVVVDVAESEY